MEGRENNGTVPGGIRLRCLTPGVWEFEPHVVCEVLGTIPSAREHLMGEPIPALLPGWEARRVTLVWPPGEGPGRVPAP
jgi:hypothetical protein